MKIKRGFGALIPGKLGRLFEDRPDDFGETVEMIKAFQRGAGLKETGWFAPGDDTAKAYGEGLKRKLPQLEDGRSEELAAGDAGPSLWQRLRGERAPKDKSLFPKGYTNWREMKELGETGSKVPHLIDQLAEKNARSDLDYKIDANFKAESQRIHGLTLLRAAEKDHGGEKRTTPGPSEEESSQPSDSLAPASESDTLTPVPPSDTTETETVEEAPAEATTWESAPLLEVPTGDLIETTYDALAGENGYAGMEGNVPTVYYDTVGIPTVGVGIALVYNDGTQWKVRDAAEFGGTYSDADEAHLQAIADLQNERIALRKGGAPRKDEALAAAGKSSAAQSEGFQAAMDELSTQVFAGTVIDLDSGFSKAQKEKAEKALGYLREAMADDSLTEQEKSALGSTIRYLEVMSQSRAEMVKSADAAAGRDGFELTLDAVQSKRSFETIEPYYRDRARDEIGGKLWGRMGEYQRAALVSATYKYWEINTKADELKTALESDLLAAMNGDDDWSETKNALKTLMADDPGRFDKTWTLFMKTDEGAQ